MVDLFTRFGVAGPMPDQTAQHVFDTWLPRWILVLGAARPLLSYQDANFESAQLFNLCALCSFDRVRRTAYYPAGNGAGERFMQTIKRGLQRMLHAAH